MLKVLMFVSLFGMLTACNAENPEKSGESKPVWVFVQVNVPEEQDGLETYYYYGSIAREVYQRIADNQMQKGFVTFKKVKYWGQDDLVHEFADGESQGDIIFRIEDIRRIERVNKEPVAGLGYEQFDEQESQKEAVSNTQAVGKEGESARDGS